MLPCCCASKCAASFFSVRVQPYVKVIKNRAYFMRYQVKYRRRRGEETVQWVGRGGVCVHGPLYAESLFSDRFTALYAPLCAVFAL